MRQVKQRRALSGRTFESTELPQPRSIGDFHLPASAPDRLTLEWRNGPDWVRLDVDLTRSFSIVSGAGGLAGTTLWQSGHHQ